MAIARLLASMASVYRPNFSNALPLLKMVAEENNLKLNRATDFKKIRILLENRYKVNKWKI